MDGQVAQGTTIPYGPNGPLVKHQANTVGTDFLARSNKDNRCYDIKDYTMNLILKREYIIVISCIVFLDLTVLEQGTRWRIMMIMQLVTCSIPLIDASPELLNCYAKRIYELPSELHSSERTILEIAIYFQ